MSLPKKQTHALFFILIADFHQAESLRRCRDRFPGSFSAFQKFLYLFRFVKSSSDTHQYPGYDAHHVIQKSISRNPDRNMLSALQNLQIRDCPHRCLCISTDTSKWCKIVFSFQISRSASHLPHVQVKTYKVIIKPLCRNRHFRIDDMIFIGFQSILITWMPVKIHLI